MKLFQHPNSCRRIVSLLRPFNHLHTLVLKKNFGDLRSRAGIEIFDAGNLTQFFSKLLHPTSVKVNSILQTIPIHTRTLPLNPGNGVH